MKGEARALLHDFYLPLLHELVLDVIKEIAHGYLLGHGRVLLLWLRVLALFRVLLCVDAVLVCHFLQLAQDLVQIALIAVVRGRLALQQGLALQVAVLHRYDINEVVQGLQQALVPGAHLLELLYAELKELGPQLRLGHAVGDVFLVPTRLVVVELEPKTHNLVVEVRAWLYKFYVQVFGRFARG